MRWGWAFAAVLAQLCLPMVAAAQDIRERDLNPPPPATAVKFSGGGQPIRFARIAFQLPPTNWARLSVSQTKGLEAVTGTSKLLTWGEDQIQFDTAQADALFNTVAAEAGLRTDTSSASLFANEAQTDLLIGARVVAMKGAFCRNCQLLDRPNIWNGRVTMSVVWEVYSTRERRVLGSIATDGGFVAPSRGVDGQPELLIYEAFKDNARRLTAADTFRSIVNSEGASSSPAPVVAALTFRAQKAGPRAISSAVTAVAAIFANEGHGSGFLISPDGYVLTNQHVVGASKYVKVRWSDGSENVGEVLRADRRRDVALIKVEAGGRAPLAYRTGAEVGQAVFAIGTPMDAKLQSTVTKGIVSARRTFDGVDFIQSDVAVNPGNSGGPLLTEEGLVIGMTVSGQVINGAPIGLNMFIPIQQALDALGLTPAT